MRWQILDYLLFLLCSCYLYNYDLFPRFWPRKHRKDATAPVTIYLRLTLHGGRAEVATDVQVPARYWPTGSQEIVCPPPEEREKGLGPTEVRKLNAGLLQLKADALNAYEVLRSPLKPGQPYRVVAPSQLLRALREAKEDAREAQRHTLLDMAQAFYDGLLAVPLSVRLQPNTLLNRRNSLRVLTRYVRKELKAAALPASIVDVPWCRQFERWCVSEKAGYSPATARMQINFLQQVLSYAVGEGWLPSPMTLHGYDFQIPLPAVTPVHLSLPEVRRLETAFWQGLFSPSVARAVAGWLFCCYTGLSWVDYRRVAARPYEFISPGPDGVSYLSMVRQKMLRRNPAGFSVPLCCWQSHGIGMPPALRLLGHYEGKLPHSNRENANVLLHKAQAQLGLSTSLVCKLARPTFSQLRRDEGWSSDVVAAMMGDTVAVMNKHYSIISRQRISLELLQHGINKADASDYLTYLPPAA